MQHSLIDMQAYDMRRTKTRRLIKDMPPEEQPYTRMDAVGLRALSTAEVLAIALGNKDGLDLAQDLLTSTNHLPGIARKNRHELATLPGIGEITARRLLAIMEIARRYQAFQYPPSSIIKTPQEAAYYLMGDMMHLEQEHFVVISLDTRNHIINKTTIYIGTLNAIPIRMSEIFEPAIRCRAAAIIVAHNHPSGDPAPSPEDVNVTRMIGQAGELLDIQVMDHIIIGLNVFYSLKERGLGFDFIPKSK
ncbi:MAG: DNA repair protein RadC [Chloroflexi bacterium]|nr:DNA repair protein RadC [Chloroflexota bacterium]